MEKKGLTHVKGIGPSMVKKLSVAQIHTLEDLVGQSTEELCRIDGIGIKTAENWISEAKQLLDGVEFHKQPPIESQVQKQEADCESENNNIELPEALAEAMDSVIVKLESSIDKIFQRMENIEQRLESIEKSKARTSVKGKKLISSILDHPFIRNGDILLEIMKEKMEEMVTKSPNIQNVFIADLYRQIIKDYSITREIFAEYLIMLFRNNKIQLEPGRTDRGFAVRDTDGNAYKIVKILE
jgi:Holliday junction resolvasome RuvABC DNA-binding subunit